MKLLFKLLLYTFVLFLAVYTSSPIWLPQVIVSQLPHGWQLEEIDVGYPGFNGLVVNKLRITGELQSTGIALQARDIRFAYRGLKSVTGSIKLDVFLDADEDSADDALTLADLSLRSTKLTGRIPELLIKKLQVSVHTEKGLYSELPLLADFQTFKLTPGRNGSFQVNTQLDIKDNLGFHGQIDFASREPMLLVSGQLETELEGGVLTVNADLQASTEGENIVVSLPGGATIQFWDKRGFIDELITRQIPELEWTPQPESSLDLEIAEASNFVILPGEIPSILFKGNFVLDMNSAHSVVNLQASGMEVEVADFSTPESAIINGKLLLNWHENASFAYRLQNGGSTPMTITADEMVIRAELVLRDGNIFSNGDGILTGGQILSMDTSVSTIEVGWQEFDQQNMTGKLSTRTRGFGTGINGELYTGFDFDVVYSLLSNTDIDGSGLMVFDSGVDLPILFTGNLQTQKWGITIPAADFSLSQLQPLLPVAHLELPDLIKLSDGHISLQADITVDEDINAVMNIKGYEISAAMLESSASSADFAFAASYGEFISAQGPLSIEVIALAGGIDITGVRVEMDIEDTDSVSLSALHADVFDGHLFVDSLRYSENEIAGTVIDITQINLSRLLAFADIDGLEGTGKLDISLPAGNDQQGIFIKDGTFKSIVPGRLVYTKEGFAGSNIGLQALENFEYENLSGSINYQSDGNYLIGVRLEGRNPDLYGGHPIVFNLNINGILPEMFKSLFITGDFEESILNQVKTRQTD